MNSDDYYPSHHKFQGLYSVLCTDTITRFHKLIHMNSYAILKIQSERFHSIVSSKKTQLCTTTLILALSYSKLRFQHLRYTFLRSNSNAQS